MLQLLTPLVSSRLTELPGCKLQWQPFEDVADAFIVQQGDETYVQAAPGIDLVPRNHKHNTRDFGIIQSYIAPENVTKLLVPSPDGRVYEGRCSLDTENGTWVTQRVGPCNSTGGYDWWYFFWSDVSTPTDREERSLDHITGWEIHPVDAHGKPIYSDALGKPIHEHHIEVKPGIGLFPPRMDFLECVFRGICFDRAVFIAQADSEFLQQQQVFDEDPRCYDVTETLRLASMYNDARPMHSPPLRWFLQVSLRWSTRTSAACRRGSISQHEVLHPAFPAGPDNLQFVIRVPRGKETFFYYTFRLPIAGTLTRDSAIHMHGENGSTGFRTWYLFNSTVEALPLPAMSKTPMPLSDAGVTFNTLSHVLEPFSQPCWLDPEIAELTHCHEWSFPAGQVFTMVAFFGGFGEPGYGYWGQHVLTIMSYRAVDGLSHITAEMGSSRLDEFDPLMSPMDLVRGFFMSAVVPYSNTALFRYVWCLIPTAFFFVVALLGSCCCASKRLLLCGFACVGGLAWAIHVQQHLRSFSGNTRDRLQFPAPRDALFVAVLLAPVVAFLLILGACAPSSGGRGGRQKPATLL